MPTTDPNPANGCPKCGGALWDNREKKTNPRAPDFKCKDKACDGVIWPPKGAKAAAAPKPDNTPRGYSGGPHIPEMDGPLASPDVESGSVFPKLERMLSVYDVCWDRAVSLAKRDLGNDASHEAIAAQTACLMITAKDIGLLR